MSVPAHTDTTRLNLTGPAYTVPIHVDGHQIDTLIDTGSVVSLLPEEFVRSRLSSSKLIPSSELTGAPTFITASGDELPYLGAIEVQLACSSMNNTIPATFLVIPSNNHATALIGTNILECLDIDKVKNNRRLLKACQLVEKVNQYRPLCVLVKTRIPANSLVFDIATMTVPPAAYSRTIMISPTNEAKEMKNLQFVESCITVPADCNKVDIPYRVGNVTDSTVTLQKNFPMFVVATVKVTQTSPDPRTVVLDDDEFLKQFDIDFSDFDESQGNAIRGVLLKHKRIFAVNDHQLGCLKDVTYHIELNDPTPVKQRYRPLHPNLREKVQEQLKVMEETGVIQQSTSLWSSPLTVATKKDGSLRLCVDFRRLNSQAKRDAKPLPRIEETLSLLNGNKFFSSCDLLSGYWQLELDNESKALTAFSAGSEALYEFNRLPFGYSSSGMHFQRSVENVLRDLMYSHCLIYLDDILIKSYDLQSHINSLDLVFSRLFEAGLRLKAKKCHLFQHEVKFLGFLVTPQGIKTDPDKTLLIKNWPVPTTTREVRQYLGIVSYYRKFIPQFSKTATPLTELLKGKLVNRGNHKMFVPVEFVWTDRQQSAFEELRRALLEDVCLNHPDFSQPFVLEIDASRGALGAVLSQEVNGQLRPIAFASRKTNSAESNYPAHRLEFLALKWAVTTKFRDYLQYTPFKVLTDNNPLLYILNKLDIDAVSQRWIAELSKYDFQIVYRTGKSNTAADSLSRLTSPIKDDGTLQQWCIEKSHVKAILSGATEEVTTADQSIISECDDNSSEDTFKNAEVLLNHNEKLNWNQIQRDDPDICYTIEHIVEGQPNNKKISKQSSVVKTFYRIRKSLHMKNGLLCRTTKSINCKDQVVLNPLCLPTLIHLYHDLQNHMGEDRTVQLLKERFYWPNMTTHIRNTLKCCTVCRARKVLPSRNKEEMFHRPVAKAPMEILAMDHLVVTNKNSRIQALIIIDEYTKFLFIIPVKNLKAATTVDAIVKNVFTKYGYPTTIHSDNSSSFVNQVTGELFKLCGIQQTKSTPYHSQGNPICERANGVVLNLLGILPEQKKNTWYKYADVAAYSYNTSIHSSTGFSPFYLLFGRKPRLIGDALLNMEFEEPHFTCNTVYMKNLKLCYKLCRERLEREHIRFKELYDGKQKRIINLERGDVVLCRNYAQISKLDNRWMSSPFIITEQPQKDIPVYKIKELSTNITKVCHRNQLLPLFQCENIVDPPTKITDTVKTSQSSDTSLPTIECDTVETSCSKPTADVTTDSDGRGFTEFQPNPIQYMTEDESEAKRPPQEDVDSDGSNTEEPTDKDDDNPAYWESTDLDEPTGIDNPTDVDNSTGVDKSSDIDQSTDSDDHRLVNPTDVSVYRTRSGRPSKPPVVYSPSKTLIQTFDQM